MALNIDRIRDLAEADDPTIPDFTAEQASAAFALLTSQAPAAPS